LPDSSNSDKPEILTESTKIYPSGRGKVLVISTKKIIRKKKEKNKNRICLYRRTSNPQSVSIAIYKRNGSIESYLFPERMRFSKEDIAHLIGTLNSILAYRTKHIGQYKKIVIPQDLKIIIQNETLRQLKRIKKWKKKIDAYE